MDAFLRVLDVPYASVADGRKLAMDLLVPSEAQPGGRFPAVLWLHGGGWYSGNKRNAISSGMLDDIVRAGFIVASVEYRLSGEALFPAQIHDVKAALRFLRAEADTLGINPDCIAIAGFSAGAHLAALAATSAGNAVLEDASLGLSTHVSAAIILAAPTDFVQNPRATYPTLNPHAAEGHPCAEHLLVGGPVLEHLDLADLANPLRYIGPEVPPFLIVHGRHDEIVPIGQAELLYTVLVQAGAKVTFIEVEDGNHGFWEADRPYPLEPLPPGLMRWIVRFLQQHLQAGDEFRLHSRNTVRVAQLR